MMSKKVDVERSGVALVLLLVCAALSGVHAQLGGTPRPLEPIPGFAEFNRLSSGRGDTRLNQNTVFPIMSAIAALQPVTNLGYAWGTYSQLNDGSGLYQQILTKSLLSIAVSTGFDSSSGLPSAAIGVFACGIVSSDLSIDCFGATPMPAGVSSPPAGTYFRVAAGYDHACGISFDGSLIDTSTLLLNSESDRSAFYASVDLECWGNETIETGGTISNFNAGSLSVNTADPYVEVAAGAFFTCVRTLSGVLTCGGLSILLDTNLAAGRVSGDMSSYVPGGTFGIVAAGPNNFCAVNSANSLQCGGIGLVGSAVTASGWSYSRESLSVGNNFVCGIDDSTNIVQCARDTEIQDQSTFESQVGDVQAVGGVRAVAVNQLYVCVTDFEFNVTCSSDTVVIGNPVYNSGISTVTCSQTTPCGNRIVVDTSSSPLYTCTLAACSGTGWFYDAGGSNQCTQREVLNPYPLEVIETSGDCTIIIDYTLQLA
uniref:Uncharacterized protein n=1 Tax=Erythrolobus australicus TaxID=1077150 RepID=A0A7S1XGW2_9RHOD|mmetsp:Transcript_2901/g.7976  ORF Transcript_2901/g.7976 Transcript_2901/m.7976 type:complete len:484 (+) Transcript_2901:134-1585(+)